MTGGNSTRSKLTANARPHRDGKKPKAEPVVCGNSAHPTGPAKERPRVKRDQTQG